jgi:hypothetical protein
VTASAEHAVVDRRRIEPVEPGVWCQRRSTTRAIASISLRTWPPDFPDDIAVLRRPAYEILHGPRARLGPPWTKDHRAALAATVVAG